MTTATGDRVGTPHAAVVTPAVRPVMLLTLNVPFAEPAVEAAIGAAADTGARLLVCDAMRLAVTYQAHIALQWAEQDNRRAAREVCAHARARGVETELVAFHNRHPIQAALDVCRDHEIGLLVFGADRERLGRLTYRLAVRRLRRDAGCLLWIE